MQALVLSKLRWVRSSLRRTPKLPLWWASRFMFPGGLPLRVGTPFHCGLPAQVSPWHWEHPSTDGASQVLPSPPVVLHPLSWLHPHLSPPTQPNLANLACRPCRPGPCGGVVDLRCSIRVHHRREHRVRAGGPRKPARQNDAALGEQNSPQGQGVPPEEDTSSPCTSRGVRTGFSEGRGGNIWTDGWMDGWSALGQIGTSLD